MAFSTAELMSSSSVALLILGSLLAILVLEALPMQIALAHGVADQVNDNVAESDTAVGTVTPLFQSFTAATAIFAQ
jgi:hypothetical protein